MNLSGMGQTQRLKFLISFLRIQAVIQKIFLGIYQYGWPMSNWIFKLHALTPQSLVMILAHSS